MIVRDFVLIAAALVALAALYCASKDGFSAAKFGACQRGRAGGRLTAVQTHERTGMWSH
jgi:hypothetical protein